MSSLVGACGIIVIPDSAISCSCQFSRELGATSVRFGSPCGWTSSDGLSESKWIMFDLGEKKEVRSIHTKGCYLFGWLSSYAVSYSDDGSTWSRYVRTLDGNIDDHSTKINDLSPTIYATFVRLHPVSEGNQGWGKTWTLQAELIGSGGQDPQYGHSMLVDMWKDQDFTDCRLVCGGRTFLCHRIVLATASPVWRTALKGGFREAHEATIAIGDAEPVAVEALLKYIYTHIFDQEFAVCLLPLAHKYALDDLMGSCVHAVVRSITKDNIVEVASLLSTFIEHTTVATVWPSLVEKVCADTELADVAMRCVRRRVS